MENITVRRLLDAGVHFGHRVQRWNPKMKKYIYGVHNGTHIVDLPQTVDCMNRALNVLRGIVKDRGRVLFVGTKQQAKDIVKVAAQKCGQYYVDHRWLGGTLTNWRTIVQSINRLNSLKERISSDDFSSYTKKEQLCFKNDVERLERALGGIKDMGGLPDVLFIIDINKEAIATREARQLGIPVIAIVDTNSNPDGIDYPIPGNDDAIKAIQLYCDIVSDAVISGIQEEMRTAGVEISQSKDLPQSSESENQALLQAFGGADSSES
ncbi:30S ribosomal protein S2 [Candidatus Hydrogenosomobacter endosymbioticus]|uniref:Small ribosomal subunit protein uS2 n=1 Tax=Candidatus Hydrogenosomobacter endosymbioticus TaxID=2558174 RepID=A0ABM7V8S2_9PROT|nr:30S ribosomal protein S2 [Candidatus Hydrogenosomobacter endosymbioticus]BDB95873.1 30S ribosomal protein S2 [Candidatus Hydrogenosomobacter endosymbioticus]